jgi:hypothetical protein
MFDEFARDDLEKFFSADLSDDVDPADSEDEEEEDDEEEVAPEEEEGL